MARKATGSRTQTRPKSAGKRKSKKKSAQRPQGAAVDTVLLLAFQVAEALDEPLFGGEYTHQGDETEYYTETIHPLLDEAWEDVGEDIAAPLQRMHLLVEGRMNYPKPGIPTGETGLLLQRLKAGMRELFVEGNTRTEVIRASGLDCQIELSYGLPNLVARYCEAWKGEATGSGAGIWNQPLVSDSRRQHEEPEMPQQEINLPSGDLSSANAHEVVRQFDTLNKRVTAVQKPIREELQTILDGLSERSFDSLEANQQVANELQFLMLRLDVRLRCPRKGCGKPAIIRCKQSGNARDGTFVFEHPVDGKLTIHSSSTKLPGKLRLVSAPAHGRRKRRRKARR